MKRRRAIVLTLLGLPTALGLGSALFRDDLLEKRVAVLEPGRLVRGAWQRPGPLRRIIERERIRTIVSLTAINRDDPKYVAQAKVVRETGVEWIIVPMRGSRATLDQMAEAADLLADTKRQPAFFHCVAGHHRTSLVHAAYRIRHEGWSASRAWDEVASLPWARPSRDREDRQLIEAFAAAQSAGTLSRRDVDHANAPSFEVGHPANPGGGPARVDVRGGPHLDEQPRRGPERSGLPLGSNAGGQPRPGRA
ncbi:fused DSP-PTPase phosphatase/NAD kinase-like protein [Singulisphaera sp. GP187]|uniref:fused DSP-PTPase phosphatase/NAD kinase-like protein n=1 Tax=Singulisphaera sp. GP187 TaxID=1882752 RepID=UPI0011612688|nr:hypothetical protein [Singulisphaera sp. GP187]